MTFYDRLNFVKISKRLNQIKFFLTGSRTILRIYPAAAHASCWVLPFIFILFYKLRYKNKATLIPVSSPTTEPLTARGDERIPTITVFPQNWVFSGPKEEPSTDVLLLSSPRGRATRFPRTRLLRPPRRLRAPDASSRDTAVGGVPAGPGSIAIWLIGRRVSLSAELKPSRTSFGGTLPDFLPFSPRHPPLTKNIHFEKYIKTMQLSKSHSKV